MAVSYEWDIESFEADIPDGDTLDHNHADALADFRRYDLRDALTQRVQDGEATRLVLVRDADDGRSWAYVRGEQLPTHFRDAFEHEGTQVPARFHRELEKAAKWARANDE